MDQIECRVTGKVQGVFFRTYVKDFADKIGLVGRVRNDSDGSVYVMAQGMKDHLEDFIEKVRVGSPSSKVESIDVNWSHRSGYYEHFKIDY
jgi:acylphosphatase